MPPSRDRKRAGRLLVRLTAGLLLVAVDCGRGEAQITLDGTLGPSGALTGPAYVIGSDLGQTRGANVFHSFGQFNVHTGESATFTGPGTIQNILSRVTGGNQSLIDGRLRSEIPGANLYLLNPKGVVFGPNAALDVSGAFRASTADVLRFSDGTAFHADPTTPPVLTVASPTAFGFLAGNPVSITVQGSRIQVSTGQTLSLVGGDVQILGGRLQAAGGRVEIVSVGSPGTLTFASEAGTGLLQLDGFARLGHIDIAQGAFVTTQGDPGGTVAIRGGILTLDRAAFNSGTIGAADHPGLGIDVNITGAMTLRVSEIASSSIGAGAAGDVRISAGSLELAGDPATGFNSNIGSRAFASGRGGDVAITAGRLVLRDIAFINAPSLGAGPGGNVDIEAGTLELLGDRGLAFIATGAFGTADAGDLNVAADSVLIRGGPGGFVGLATQVSTPAQAPANAGRLTLTADDVTLLDGGQLSSGVFSGAGRGGDIEVTANSLSIAGTNPFGFRSGIFATLEGPMATGRGGDIRVTASELRLADRGSISTSLFDSPGSAGNITVDARMLEISGAAFIASSALFGSGDAGNVDIVASQIRISGIPTSRDPSLTDFTGISTSTRVGRGGTLRITADDVQITDKGALASVSTGPGRGGDIHLELGAGRLLVTGGATVSSSAFGSGAGGSIDIVAGEVTVAGAGQFNGPQDAGVSAIASQAGLGGGAAGDLRIFADTLHVLDGGKITAETFGAGAGGRIEISAGSVVVDGVNRSLEAALGAVPGADPAAAASAITASTSGFFLGESATGSAGGVAITTGDLQVSAGGVIATRTDSRGDGGTIRLVADRVTLASGGQLVSSAGVGSAGRGGDIEVIAGEHVSISGRAEGRASGLFSTTGGTGSAGTIVVTTPQLAMSERGTISVQTEAAGDAGSIALHVGVATLATGARIDSSTSGNGRGGTITLGASSGLSITDAGSGLFSTAQGGGDAGTIEVSAPMLTLASGGAISVATAGSGRAGDVTVNVGQFIAVDGGRIDSGTTGDGAGGSITIDAVAVALAGGVLASNAAADGPGGNVTVTARKVDLAGNATISARSSSSGNAGDVVIHAGDAFTARGSAITTQAVVADGGNIVLTAPRMIRLADSQVTTSVESGFGGGGNILIDPRFLLLSDSEIRAQAFGGPGGNVRMAADIFLAQDSVISASSMLGVPGTIDIQASITDLSGTLAVLPESVLQAATLLRASCAARLAGGRASSLVVAGPGGVPPDPGWPLSSPLFALEPGEGLRLSGEGGPSATPTFPDLRVATTIPRCW